MANKEATAKPETAKYKVSDITLHHNGKNYPIGATVELTADEAKPLAAYVKKVGK